MNCFSEPEDYVPPPQKANIGDILAQALELSAIKDEAGAAAKKPTGKKSKKMKGQKICLTGGRLSLNWTKLRIETVFDNICRFIGLQIKN